MSRGFRQRARADKESRLRGLAKVPAKESGLTAEDLVRVHSTTNHGGAAMARRIPLTNFTKYMTEAQAIGRNLRESAGSLETVRQTVMDLTDLAAKSLEEAAQVFEGLALVVLSQHPAVTRARPREKRVPRAKAAPRP